MGTGSFTTRANEQVIDASHPNEIQSAMSGDFVGRNSSGVPTSNQNLGTAAFPWGVANINSIILAGGALDASQIVAPANRIVSGATRSGSGQPMFLDASGVAPSVTIQGLTTPLVLNIKAVAVSIVTDIVKTSLTLGPSTTNTANINDPGLADQDFTKYLGENGTTIPIDGAGANVTSQIGQIVCFKLATEFLIGFLKSATEITNCYRGYFFDTAQLPVVRETLANNDVLTIMSLSWLFAENNATLIDASVTTPTIGFLAPVGPGAGDYWLDLTNAEWKRFDGSTFQTINRTLIGVAVVDSANCVAVRPFDFDARFKGENTIELEKQSASVVQSVNTRKRIDVYGSELLLDYTHLTWDTAVNFESGVSEAASTRYYLYLSNKGEATISDQAPFDRPDLHGKYHPYHNWRWLGSVDNDSSSDFENASSEFNSVIQDYKTVGSVGDLGQKFAGHRFEIAEAGTTAAEVLAYYKFASGALETDEKGAFALTAVNTPTNTPGILGETFATNLAAGSSQHYTQATLLDVVPASLAIDFWIKVTDGNPAAVIKLFAKENIGGNSDIIELELTSAGLIRLLTAENANGVKVIAASRILDNGVNPFIYICITWDTVNGTRMFINGVLEARDPAETTLMADGSNTDFFLGSSTTATNFVDGKIALFRVRDKTLTQKDIDQGYASKHDLPTVLNGLDLNIDAKIKLGGDDDFVRRLAFEDVSRTSSAIYRKGGVVFGAEIDSTDKLQIKARL